MTAWNPRANEVFDRASELDSPADRVAYLERECAGDGNLRREVDALLRAHETRGNLLDGTVCDLLRPASELCPGTDLGRYRLFERIGEGGFADVYRAEQTEPVRREVAVKIIKPGMDSRQVIARFEAERQALAMMDHPNIAKFFDAGTTVGVRNGECGVRNEEQEAGTRGRETGAELLSGQQPIANSQQPRHSELRTPHSIGRPYFVMELIRGVPITKYCYGSNVDLNPRYGRCPGEQSHRTAEAPSLHEPARWQRAATLRERLELFLDVCRAVQHAHQKGVIHRDLKPTNILVEPQADGRGVVKIIDFGIAKATQQRLTQHTLATESGQLLGTPEYMSPEQATFHDADVDTRSDIYSLGVLLYELLAGTTPFESAALRRLPYDEICRTIRETEPLPPSKRLTQLERTAAPAPLPHSARPNLKSEIRNLKSALDPDLDWIALKCLEKDRIRRYATVHDLASDIERHLADEPVHARPPSRVYRLKKFTRKHRTGVAAATAVLLSLVGGIVIAGFSLASAIAERDKAIKNLHRSCELVDNVIAPAAQTVHFAPGVRELHANLVNQGLSFYRGVFHEGQNDRVVRHGMAKGVHSHFAC